MTILKTLRAAGCVALGGVEVLQLGGCGGVTLPYTGVNEAVKFGPTVGYIPLPHIEKPVAFRFDGFRAENVRCFIEGYDTAQIFNAKPVTATYDNAYWNVNVDISVSPLGRNDQVWRQATVVFKVFRLSTPVDIEPLTINVRNTLPSAAEMAELNSMSNPAGQPYEPEKLAAKLAWRVIQQCRH